MDRTTCVVQNLCGVRIRPVGGARFVRGLGASEKGTKRVPMVCGLRTVAAYCKEAGKYLEEAVPGTFRGHVSSARNFRKRRGSSSFQLLNLDCTGVLAGGVCCMLACNLSLVACSRRFQELQAQLLLKKRCVTTRTGYNIFHIHALTCTYPRTCAPVPTCAPPSICASFATCPSYPVHQSFIVFLSFLVRLFLPKPPPLPTYLYLPTCTP